MHSIKTIPIISDDIIVYDARVTGLQRKRYLNHMSRGACEVLECRSNTDGKLVGMILNTLFVN